jgi:uncharacterized protein (TIGR02246 family)
VKADAATEDAVMALLKRWSDCFSSKDLEGILSLFAKDADVTMLGSEDWEMGVGPEKVRSLYAHLFTRGDSATWEWKWHQVSSSGSVAWMLATGVAHIKGPKGEVSGPYRLSAVFEERDGKWLWMQFHGSEPMTASG